MAGKGAKTKTNAFNDWRTNYYIVQTYNSQNLPFKLTYSGAYSFIGSAHYKKAVGLSQQRAAYIKARQARFSNPSSPSIQGSHIIGSSRSGGNFKREHNTKSGESVQNFA